MARLEIKLEYVNGPLAGISLKAAEVGRVLHKELELAQGQPVSIRMPDFLFDDGGTHVFGEHVRPSGEDEEDNRSEDEKSGLEQAQDVKDEDLNKVGGDTQHTEAAQEAGVPQAQDEDEGAQVAEAAQLSQEEGNDEEGQERRAQQASGGAPGATEPSSDSPESQEESGEEKPGEAEEEGSAGNESVEENRSASEAAQDASSKAEQASDDAQEASEKAPAKKNRKSSRSSKKSDDSKES